MALISVRLASCLNVLRAFHKTEILHIDKLSLPQAHRKVHVNAVVLGIITGVCVVDRV
jgi:hypothetical protein